MRFRCNKIRTRLRRPFQQELLPVEITDVSSPAFAAEAHRQSLAIARSKGEKADQEFVDAISNWDSE